MSERHYRIVRASASDIDTLLALAKHGRSIMRSTGNMDQWVGGYPSREVFEADVARGSGHLVLDGDTAVGCFAMLAGPDPTYGLIVDGTWLDDTMPYHVIHRIASLPTAHGVLRAIIDYARTVDPNIRIDTHRDNTIMRHLLPTLGFVRCGIIYLANGDERIAYQSIGPSTA